MKAILIEDNIQAQELIRGLIRRHFQEIELVGTEATVVQGEKLILEVQPDLLLLDVQLRDGSVFEILDRIPEQILQHAALVFITAFGTFENIYRAMRYSAIDYLVKPIDESDFKQAIRNAIDRREQMGLVEQLRTFQHILLQSRNGSVEKMPVILPRSVIEYVPWREIIYIEGEDNICRIHLTDGRSLNSVRHLGHYRQLLKDNSRFFRNSPDDLPGFGLALLGQGRAGGICSDLVGVRDTLPMADKPDFAHKTSKNSYSCWKWAPRPAGGELCKMPATARRAGAGR